VYLVGCFFATFDDLVRLCLKLLIVLTTASLVRLTALLVVCRKTSFPLPSTVVASLSLDLWINLEFEGSYWGLDGSCLAAKKDFVLVP